MAISSIKFTGWEDHTDLECHEWNKAWKGKWIEGENLSSFGHHRYALGLWWLFIGIRIQWRFSTFGIFRDVLLEITDKIRVEPFGTHIWNNASIDSLFVETELHNYTDTIAVLSLVSKICNASNGQSIEANQWYHIVRAQLRQASPIKDNLWSVEIAYLYTLNTIIKQNGKAVDDCNTSFGVRSIQLASSEKWRRWQVPVELGRYWLMVPVNMNMSSDRVMRSARSR